MLIYILHTTYATLGDFVPHYHIRNHVSTPSAASPARRVSAPAGCPSQRLLRAASSAHASSGAGNSSAAFVQQPHFLRRYLQFPHGSESAFRAGAHGGRYHTSRFS